MIFFRPSPRHNPDPDPGPRYYNLRHDEYDAWHARGLAAWRDDCCALMPWAESVIQRVESMEQLAFASYWDATMWRFHAGRVVLLGDASHSMSPQLGQGANLALIDAEKLVDALEAHSSPQDLPAALAAYTRDRWLRVTFYQAQSRILTPIFASRSETLRVLRDHLFYYACHAPGIRQFVHAVLCGAQSPNLFGTIPPDEFLGFLRGLDGEGRPSADLCKRE